MRWRSYDITERVRMDHTVERQEGMTMMMEAHRLGSIQRRGAHMRPKVQERPVEVQRLSRQGWRLPPALANEFFGGWRFGVDRQSTVGRPRHAAC